jgi:DNA-binding transcriptional regulator YiaG
MSKLDTIIKAEIVRLAKREVRKISSPLGREVRSLKGLVSGIRKSLSALERLSARQQKEKGSADLRLEATPDQIEGARFSPRLIRTLRKRLGITQDELATLTKVSVGAVHQWEMGKFQPRDENKGALVALRGLGRREVRNLLEKTRGKIESSPKQGKKAKRRR